MPVGCLVKHQHCIVHLQREGCWSDYCCCHEHPLTHLHRASQASPNLRGSRRDLLSPRRKRGVHTHQLPHQALPSPSHNQHGSPHQPGAGAAELSPLGPAPGSKRPQLFACGSSRGARSREGIVPKSRPQRRGELKGGGEKQSWRGERNKGPPSDRGSGGLRQQSLPGKAGKRPRPHPRGAFPLSEVSHCWRL